MTNEQLQQGKRLEEQIKYLQEEFKKISALSNENGLCLLKDGGKLSRMSFTIAGYAQPTENWLEDAFNTQSFNYPELNEIIQEGIEDILKALVKKKDKLIAQLEKELQKI